ncbi:unnamed protein product [Choristocarpus tenellus]
MMTISKIPSMNFIKSEREQNAKRDSISGVLLHYFKSQIDKLGKNRYHVNSMVLWFNFTTEHKLILSKLVQAGDPWKAPHSSMGQDTGGVPSYFLFSCLCGGIEGRLNVLLKGSEELDDTFTHRSGTTEKFDLEDLYSRSGVVDYARESKSEEMKRLRTLGEAGSLR